MYFDLINVTRSFNLRTKGTGQVSCALNLICTSGGGRPRRKDLKLISVQRHSQIKVSRGSKFSPGREDASNFRRISMYRITIFEVVFALSF